MGACLSVFWFRNLLDLADLVTGFNARKIKRPCVYNPWRVTDPEPALLEEESTVYEEPSLPEPTLLEAELTADHPRAVSAVEPSQESVMFYDRGRHVL